MKRVLMFTVALTLFAIVGCGDTASTTSSTTSTTPGGSTVTEKTTTETTVK